MDNTIPFDRFRRRIARGRCEVPRCGRPTIGPIGIVTQTPMVFPCEACARERYGTADHWGVIAVLLGEAPLSPREVRALAFGRPALATCPAPD